MKKIKVLMYLAISAMLIDNVSASTIDNITAIDNNTIEIISSNDVVFSDINVKGELKLLKDIPVSFTSRDNDNFRKLILNLSYDLTADTSYSLITILGTDGNIDFNIGKYLEGEIINTNLSQGEKGIEKINLIDSRTLELYFTSDLDGDIFEFKILSDIEINSLESSGNNKLNLEISRNLEKNTSYIIMVLSLEDVMGNAISFDEDLYDLTTPNNLVEEVIEEKIIVATNEEEPEIIEEGNIEEVALNSAETPETGTATGILVILAIIVNLGFFLRKKIIK